MSCSLSDFGYHTNFEDFQQDIELDKKELKFVLRVIKHKFETDLGTKLSDELFLALIKIIPHLAPLHPLGAPQARLGYTKPLNNLLMRYNREDIDTDAIMSYLFRLLN